MKLNKLFLTFVIEVFCAIFLLIIDFHVIEDLIIPDICAFHYGKQTSMLFDLFYGFPAAEAGHPFPSVFHFFFTIFIGGTFGFFLSKIILKKMMKQYFRLIFQAVFYVH
ncbi:MAG: hypothetical protein ACK40Y_01495 [Cloacibacterium caeni]